MKERPVLFSSAMVRAILEGRKTQTRRIVKFDPSSGYIVESGGRRRWHRDDKDAVAGCPFGSVGDVLWVRETFCNKAEDGYVKVDEFWYAATDPTPVLQDGDGSAVINKDGTERSAWRPSIHMPREACRLRLGITGVKVERLQDISEEDARAEGAEFIRYGCCGTLEGYKSLTDSHNPAFILARDWFKNLWDSINGDRDGCAWKDNPWVWGLTFKRLICEPSSA